MWTRWLAGVGTLAVGSLLVASAAASTLPLVAARGDACDRAARRYEVRCLMPRIEARLQFAGDGDAVAFVARMRDIEHACLDVTTGGLDACATWPRVRPTAEYRRWLKQVRETWQRRQVDADGGRAACRPGTLQCL